MKPRIKICCIKSIEEARTATAFGVDVCTGVRTDMKLDTEKLREFVRNPPGGAGS
jgi:phosphoribosylanthranilate isomerase